ncbi:lytic polysaccharide monooxygenase [Streptomyces synnematoformans]|uniref:Lytic polysaccharide monooxygenase n=1 Tax=Streptomyces synnematoformans TaxID=415721 RepID=A0ABP5J9P6_9ACTN
MPLQHLLPRAVTTSAVAGLLLASTLAGDANAHGSTTDPPSRVYGCFDRWGSNFQDPAMEEQDPMCWQAWQADDKAMWNWNAVNREGVGGEYEAVIPDGQLCSGGLTHEGRYAIFDEPGPWQAATKPRQFTLTVTDRVPHGADYIRVYITKQGYDPITQPLGWDDLELITTTGSYPPGDGIYQTEVDAGDRTGRHVVFAIWLAAHKDESYYMCSDVIFE